MNKSQIETSLDTDKDSSSFSLLPGEKCLYMYNRDKTILYHYTTNHKDFINSLNIHYVTPLCLG